MRAYLCRYAHQNIYDLLGRDPIKSPLSNLERALFFKSMQQLMSEEFAAPSIMDP